MGSPSKAALRDELVARVEADLASAELAYTTTRAGATHEEAKPENDKDTRALELTYLARGQAARVDELRAAVLETRAMPLRAFAEGERAALGALVEASEDDVTHVYFLAPQGGGARLAGGVQVVTPRSPLGRALLGKCAGDTCEVAVAGRNRELVVERVR